MGWEAIQRGDGEKAASAFRRVLADNPNDVRALTGAGIAAHLLGQDDQAVSSLKKALQADPKNVQASFMLGGIAYGQGDLDLAIKSYERVVKTRAGRSRRLPAARSLEEGSGAARHVQGEAHRPFHRHVRRARAAADRDARVGRAGGGVRARRAVAECVSRRDGDGDSVYPAAVPRHHQGSGMGGGGLRRTDPDPGARRAEQSRGARSRRDPRVRPRGAAPDVSARAVLAERRAGDVSRAGRSHAPGVVPAHLRRHDSARQARRGVPDRGRPGSRSRVCGELRRHARAGRTARTELSRVPAVPEQRHPDRPGAAAVQHHPGRRRARVDAPGPPATLPIT